MVFREEFIHRHRKDGLQILMNVRSQICRGFGEVWTREHVYRVDNTISNSRNLEPVREFLVATIPGSIYLVDAKSLGATFKGGQLHSLTE